MLQARSELLLIQVDEDLLSMVEPVALIRLLEKSKAKLVMIECKPGIDRHVLGRALHDYSPLVSQGLRLLQINVRSFFLISISLLITHADERSSVLLSYLGFLLSHLGMQQ